MKQLVLLLLLSIITLAKDNASALEHEKVSIQLKWFHQFQFAGYYAAKEKGYYSDVGLDVEIKQRDTKYDNISQVVNGESEYGVADTSLLIYRSNKEPVVIISPILQHSPSVLITLKSRGIDNPYSLNNKNILFYKSDLDGMGILAMLNSLKIKANISKIKEGNDYHALLQNKADAYSGYITNEPFYLKEDKHEVNIINPANYGFDFYGDMLFTNEFESKNHPNRVKRFKEATLKGWEYALDNKEELIHLIKKRYAKNKSIEHLRYEAAALEQLIQHKSIPLGTIDKGRFAYITEIYKKYGLIKSDIDEEKYIFKFYDEQNITNYAEKGSLFSSIENEYLKNKDEISMCIDPNWMPFEKVADGKHIGISSDYMNLVSKVIGKEIVLVKTKTWAESLDFAKERKCDILSLVMATPERRKYYDFTKPYLKVPLVVVSRNKELFIDDVTQINKKLGIVKNYAYGELLRKKYPDMKIIDVENVKDGLDKVNKDELYGFIGTLASTGYEIQKNYIGYLKIVGKFDESWDLSIGVRNDEPILKNVLDKALNTVSEEKHQQILNKWLVVKFINTTNSAEVIKWIVIVLIISAVIISFILKKNSQLHKEIVTRKSIENELENTLELFNLGETTLFKWKNDKEWSIEYASKNTTKVLGYDVEDFMSEKIKYSELIHPDDVSRVTDEVQSNISKESFVHLPYRVQKGNGEYIWVTDKTKIIKDSNGNALNFLGYIRDITREIEQQEEIEVSHKNLVKSEKLAALGQLLANIAHEINSPLGAIKSSVESNTTDLSYFINNYTQVLEKLDEVQKKIFLDIVNGLITNNEFLSSTQERAIKKETIKILNEKEIESARILSDKLTRLKVYKQKDVLSSLPLLLDEHRDKILKMLLVISKLYTSNHNIQEAINTSTKTILALKTYAHSTDERASITTRKLKESLDTVLTIYNNKLKYNVNLSYETEDLEPYTGNHDELMQVWTNLIHNALHAMDNKGDLVIKIYQVKNEQIVLFKDSGSGMDEATLSKIFEPFFTTKPTGVGSGLGLDIIQNIVHKHNGRIEVNSELNIGSTFKIILPF